MRQKDRRFIKLIPITLVTVSLFCSALFSGCQLQTGETQPASADSSASSAVAAADALPDTSEFAVLFVNVGKADAAIARFGDVTVLIDTGSEESAPQLIAGLNLLGVTKIDALFLTHSHSDHVGGLDALGANYEIETVYLSSIGEQTKNGVEKVVKLCEGLSLPHAELNAGQSVAVTDDVSFSILGPLEMNEDDDNDNSLVLRFTVQNTTFLLTGDMQFAEEDTLLDAGIDLSADVLKVGNHGNPDATGRLFAAAVSPALAIISTDTSADTNSASSRVVSALSGAEVLVTEDFPLGVLLTLDESGKPVVSDPAVPASGLAVSIGALDSDAQTITLVNDSGAQADLSGCILYSERSGAVLRIPDGTLLSANGTLLVSGSDGNGDLHFSGEDKPLDKKKKNTVVLYSALGAQLDSLHQ